MPHVVGFKKIKTNRPRPSDPKFPVEDVYCFSNRVDRISHTAAQLLNQVFVPLCATIY
jgi:hypothetical protein